MLKRFIATGAAIFVVSVGTATAAETAQGLRADGLRLTAMAQRYQQLHGMTPAGLYADGLRWQGVAQRYQELHGLTPAALYAEGLRWQAMARAYESRSPVTATSSSGSSFNWGDAGIGAAGGFVLFVCGAAAIVFVRRSRRTKLAL